MSLANLIEAACAPLATMGVGVLIGCVLARAVTEPEGEDTPDLDLDLREPAPRERVVRIREMRELTDADLNPNADYR